MDYRNWSSKRALDLSEVSRAAWDFIDPIKTQPRRTIFSQSALGDRWRCHFQQMNLKIYHFKSYLRYSFLNCIIEILSNINEWFMKIVSETTYKHKDTHTQDPESLPLCGPCWCAPGAEREGGSWPRRSASRWAHQAAWSEPGAESPAGPGTPRSCSSATDLLNTETEGRIRERLTDRRAHCKTDTARQCGWKAYNCFIGVWIDAFIWQFHSSYFLLQGTWSNVAKCPFQCHPIGYLLF